MELQPGFIEVDSFAQKGPVSPGWEPELLKARAPYTSSLYSLTWGFSLLVVGWLTLSAIGFIEDQFNRSTGLGVLTLTIFGSALALLFRGLGAEAKTYRELRKVDALRRLLSEASSPPAEVRAACETWVRSVAQQLSDPHEALDARAGQLPRRN
jgi:hypothetical protein